MSDKVAVRIAWDPKNPSNAGKVKQVDSDEARRLVTDGRAAYVEATDETKTVAEILADVGDDAVKAQEALDAENAGDKPRVTLVEKLTEIAAAGQLDPTRDAAAFGGGPHDGAGGDGAPADAAASS